MGKLSLNMHMYRQVYVLYCWLQTRANKSLIKNVEEGKGSSKFVIHVLWEIKHVHLYILECLEEAWGSSYRLFFPKTCMAIPRVSMHLTNHPSISYHHIGRLYKFFIGNNLFNEHSIYFYFWCHSILDKYHKASVNPNNRHVL